MKTKSVSILIKICILVSVLFTSCKQQNFNQCWTNEKNKIIQQYNTIINRLKDKPENQSLILRLQDERNKKIKEIGC